MSAAADPAAPAQGGGGTVRVTIVIAVVLCAILEVLDSTIVNVALPHIQAAFGATNDQITWILTSYIVASVVVMPLTGFLSRRIGRRTLILSAVTGFAAFSMLCGASWSLGVAVLFRLGQGSFGAFLIPLAQSILFDSFPRHKRGQAMAMFGLGIIVAPVLGPTLGALLTEYFSWRMVFYVNLPIAALALLLLTGELPADKPQKIRTDWLGLALLGVSVGALQFVLDQGQSKDWFASHVIEGAAVVSAVAGLFFFVHGFRNKNNIINLSLFADRNFTLSSLIIAGFAVSMFGAIAIQPLFVQNLLGYSVLDAGYMFIPRGLTAGFSMVITGSVLSHRFDTRILAACGLIITAVGNFMLGALNLNADFWQIALPGAVSGLGMGLIFVPLSTLAFEKIPQVQQDEASGLYGVTRQLGSSIGIAIVGALLVRYVAVNSAQLTQHVTPYSAAARAYLHPLGMSPETARGAAVLSGEVAKQAAMMAYARMFDFLGWAAVVLIPFLAFMHKAQPHGEGGAVAH